MNKDITILIIAAVTIITLGFILTAPNEKAVTACVNQTGWTTDRCFNEISK